MAAHNLVRMTVTGTPGVGTITLGAADTGALTFALGGVLDGERVSYGIVDGGNHEVGVGIYTATGTTLSRSIIRSSTNAGAAISCTTAAKVYITNAAQDNYLHGFAYFPGKYYAPNGGGSTGNAMPVNSIQFKGMAILARLVVSQVSYSIQNVVTGTYAVGLYANDVSNCSPTGAPIWTSGVLSCPASSGTQSITTGTPFTLDAGIYWAAVVCSAAAQWSQTTGGPFDHFAYGGVNANNYMQFGSSSGSPSKTFTMAALPTLTGNPTTDSIANGGDRTTCPNLQFLAS